MRHITARDRRGCVAEAFHDLKKEPWRQRRGLWPMMRPGAVSGDYARPAVPLSGLGTPMANGAP